MKTFKTILAIVAGFSQLVAFGAVGVGGTKSSIGAKSSASAYTLVEDGNRVWGTGGGAAEKEEPESESESEEDEGTSGQ